MKRTNNAIWKIQILIIIITLFVACKKENEETVPPSIMIMSKQGYISSDTAIAPGSDIRLKILMQKGDLNITNFLIDVYTDNEYRMFKNEMKFHFINPSEFIGCYAKNPPKTAQIE